MQETLIRSHVDLNLQIALTTSPSDLTKARFVGCQNYDTCHFQYWNFEVFVVVSDLKLFSFS